MGRFVLVAAAIVAAALASCYQPGLVDCADTCGTSGLCPDGLSCMNGYCRTPGATGACASSGNDARPGPDGAGSTCMMAPQGHGAPVTCENVHPAMPAAPQCYVACGTGATGSDAAMFAFMSWRGASITSGGDENNAASAAGAAETWLGLVAPAGSGASPAAWHWTNGAQMMFMHWANGQPTDQGAAGNCGALTGSGWVSEPCTKTLPFLIGSPLPP